MIKKMNPTLIKVVNFLNDGAYHDGNSIGQKLKISRNAVWKTIKKLTDYGINIEAIKGKGYRMPNPLLLLEKEKIKKQVKHKIDLVCYEYLPSTNDYFKSVKSNDVMFCVAECQTHGKGRLGRNWYSPFGQNLYLSCFYPFKKDMSELAGLSLVVSLAIYQTLKSHGLGNDLQVKWPNDVIYQQQKIAGNLIEVQAETHGSCYATIGVGINVNMTDAKVSLNQKWVSIGEILGIYLDRNNLCAALIDHLLDHVKEFAVNGLAGFVPLWESLDSLNDQVITLKQSQEKIVGKVNGINQQGHLLLRLKNGKVQAFASGDTSIMKR